MKNIIYIFLTVSLIFSSCSKEKDESTPTEINGCTDTAANNYDATANEDDGSCLYLITGCWEWETGVIDGIDIFSTNITEVVLYFWDDGKYGIEYYTSDGLVAYDEGTYSLSSDQTTMNTTSMTYVSDGVGGWDTDFIETTTLLAISKFNSNEFDGGWDDNDGIGNFTSKKSTNYFLNGWK